MLWSLLGFAMTLAVLCLMEAINAAKISKV